MAKYDVECPLCQGTYVVQLVGRNKDRQYKLDHWDWTCDECRRKILEEENKKAAAENQAEGLPPLTGTEKQILWAESIRKKMLERIAEQANSMVMNVRNNMAADQEKTDRIAMRSGFTSAAEVIVQIGLVEQQIIGTTSSAWWIDNRSIDIKCLLEKAVKEKAKQQEESPGIDTAKGEATVRPEKPRTETVAEIRVSDKYLEVDFPEKREDFWRLIKKQLGFSWSGSCWQRSLDGRTGEPIDRVAETGNRLLAAGFLVRIFNDEARCRAISGEFTLECHRWVMTRIAGPYNGWFSLSWPKGDDFYTAAKRLTGAKYDRPDVVVPAEHFEQVIDFAETHGFSLSLGAKKLVEEARMVREKAMVSSPAKVGEKKLAKISVKPEKLAIPEQTEVADELRDSDN